MNGILLATQSGTVNLNIDSKTLDMCIKGVSNFGSTTYMNICNGQSMIVPMGGFDWLVAVMLMCGGLLLLGVFLRIIFF